MSAKAIESQIEQISVEMERRKELFMAEMRELESRKSLLLQQLNAVRDPIARLPLEVSSEIFLQCLPPQSKACPLEYARPQARLAPLLLLNICNTWTNIALSTPALWALIGIGFPRPTGFQDLLERWLRRAGSRRLQISIKGACDSLMASSILQHSAQLQSLCVSFDETNAEELDDGDEFCYELLGGILPEMELPSLQVLVIFGQAGMPTNLLWPSVHRLLRLSPNLTELNIQNINFMTYVNEELPETFVLPHLGHLTHFDGFEVFNFSAPRLETLYVSTWALFDDTLISFLRQSSPPLLKLKLYGGCNVAGSLDESISLIPTLTHLESLFLGSAYMTDLFGFLAKNLHVAPNLQSIQMESIDDDEDHDGNPIDILTPLVSMISARRGGLRKVRLTTTSWSMEPLPDDVAAILRQFLADGVDIHFGPVGGLNILSQ
ncbi:hypothetical protein FB45DRAFT_1042382 [Roridomyces roridus]|uniref:F-box domain-containing protein n=1 Tax=Roridomyces roridus TaxID=1738132 RepID=A0AAD7F8M4_9AGAR|nr:hypothetical protein FB45DRAFT_1042382 [Roridomyces roridus]